VFRVINGLSRLGADVVHKGNAMVHVSGHAAEGELTYVYNVVRPANVMPVHGEWRHQRANGEIATRTGVPADRVVLADNGTVVDLVDGVAMVVGAVPCGFVYVDGATVGDVTEASLKDRRILGSEGFISVVAVVDLTDGKVVGGPDIHARGFAEDESVFDEVRPRVAAALEDALRDGASDSYELQRVMRRAIGKWVSDTHRRRPMIIPVVVEV
jgi:ribonuclease J